MKLSNKCLLAVGVGQKVTSNGSATISVSHYVIFKKEYKTSKENRNNISHTTSTANDFNEKIGNDKEQLSKLTWNDYLNSTMLKSSNIYSYGATLINSISLNNKINMSQFLSEYKSYINNYVQPFTEKSYETIAKNLNSLNENIKSLNKTIRLADNKDFKIKIKLNENQKWDAGTPQPPQVVSTAITRNQIEEKVINLCQSIEKATSLLIKSTLMDELFKQLYEFPEVRYAIYRRERKFLNHLVNLRQNSLVRQDKRLFGNVNQCLALLGHADPSLIKHRGVNVLSLDGGGSKGFVTIEILKNIQKQCDNKPIHEIFDYICGVSTGSVLACLLGVYKMSLTQIEEEYKRFVKEIFQRNKAAGISNLIMSYGYYDTKIWENMLIEAMGDTKLINSAKEEKACKISIVTNVTTPTHMKIFLFRNYNLPPAAQSHYDGTTKYKCWETVRASSAAPGYYEDFKLDGYIFHDGGLLANNPTAIALHESKQLWPNVKTNCVVSIGNGRYQPPGLPSTKATSISLKQKVNRIIGGISCTENVHTLLLDLLPAKMYYRFNPFISEEFHLDEDRPNKWKTMQYDTNMYMRRNDTKFQLASKQLLTPKSKVKLLEEYLMNKLNA